MSQSYSFDIETLLNECQPVSVLVAGNGADTVIDNYVEHKKVMNQDCRIVRITPDTEFIDQRYDMGVVSDTVEYMEKRDAIRLLSRFRDLYTARFCAAVRMGDGWPDLESIWTRNELLGVGMRLLNSYEDDQGRRVHLYTYDIDTYKPTPRWLNPRDWANPELWDKYRW